MLVFHSFVIFNYIIFNYTCSISSLPLFVISQSTGYR
jgi:hypothetical protein